MASSRVFSLDLMALRAGGLPPFFSWGDLNRYLELNYPVFGDMTYDMLHSQVHIALDERVTHQQARVAT